MKEQGHASVAISMIVLNWNKSKLTEDCIVSLKRCTSASYEIIVVDNGSEKEEYDKLVVMCRREGATLVSLNQNVGFGEANNIAAELARGENLLLVNNDLTVTPGYLDPMLHGLRSGFRAGAVGPRYVYPDGRLQEAGAYVQSDGRTLQHGSLEPAIPLIAGPGLHVVDYCSAACLLVPRLLFLSVGGFDLVFDPAYYEDVDLAFRLRSRGYYTYLCGDVDVIHLAGATSGEVWNADQLGDLVEKNRLRFVERWGGWLADRAGARSKPVFEEVIEWTSEPSADSRKPAVLIRGPGIVGDLKEWPTLLRAAAELCQEFFVVILAEEVCSRCRMLRLASRLNLRLEDFAVQRASDRTISDDDTVVSLDYRTGAPTARGPAAERAQQLLDHLTGG